MNEQEQALILARFDALRIAVAFLLDRQLGPDMDFRRKVENVLCSMEGAPSPEWTEEMMEGYKKLLDMEMRTIFQFANSLRPGSSQQS